MHAGVISIIIIIPTGHITHHILILLKLILRILHIQFIRLLTSDTFFPSARRRAGLKAAQNIHTVAGVIMIYLVGVFVVFRVAVQRSG